ncbi:MAG: 2,3-bisphosphoglycerate-independent phosphoglycerate mutase [Verrucomicrobia bacterium CG_4_9_14_3_um_filter_43_20]|nr:MAG: 2,3-bisphosphoglycerate-independent phosphoglycerate mutase [Verrucomicrobia bacterium CG_4_9_14_3_um_filter_43_20]
MEDIRPVVLIIRDGWGSNHNPEHNPFNAIYQADTPVDDELARHWPRTEIKACGRDVGLPDGVMGNSEVGHQNIGAGRIVDQEIVRIDKAIEGGEISKNSVLNEAFEHVKKNNSRLHFIGLVSDAGVHAMLRHLYGLLKCAKDQAIKDVFIHAITDGRDTAPTGGERYIKELEAQCQTIGVGKVATVSGRYWAMDRDKRWNRVQKAYDCMCGVSAIYQDTSAEKILAHAYKTPVSETQKGDEFIEPSWVVDHAGKPIGSIADGDVVIFFNFRGDRPRELVTALTDKNFKGFERAIFPKIMMVTMTSYEEGLCDRVLFTKPPKMKNILGEYVSNKGIAQFRCAETEKHPHVTFFFNDYREEPFPKEDRKMVDSPKEVATYDEKPEMSAYAVCATTKEAILSKKYGLIVVNFANADMVGHTGSLEAATKAVEVVDECVGVLLKAIDEIGGAAIVTADHGNADQMWNPKINSPHTQHTLNLVELIVYGKSLEKAVMRKEGRLADIAPTILELMGLDTPKEMTGQSLIKTLKPEYSLHK